MSATVGIANWGPLIIGTDVDDAVLAALTKWMPTYLAQIKTERNLSFTPALPRTYSNTFAGQEFLDHQLPALIVVTAQSTVTRGGMNMPYEGTFALRVASVVRGKRPPATRFLAALYEGVVRRLVLQKARGDGTNGTGAAGPINDLHYMGLRYEEVPDGTGAGRYTLAALSLFEVFSDQIVQPFGGPNIPDAATYLDGAAVTEVDITVLGETITIPGPSGELDRISPMAGSVTAGAFTVDCYGNFPDPPASLAVNITQGGYTLASTSVAAASAQHITASFTGAGSSIAGAADVTVENTATSKLYPGSVAWTWTP
jgi:hypothetical protein